jgi:hypothetical protein
LTWSRRRIVFGVRMADLVKVTEDLAKSGPERRTPSRSRDRQQVQDIVYVVTHIARRWNRQAAPKSRRNQGTDHEMRARSIAKTTGTGSRLAWDPTHAPSDETRPVSTGGRQVQDGIHLENRTTSANQNLWGGL